MTLSQILFHFHLVFRPAPPPGRPCAEKTWWAPTILTVGSLCCLIKLTAIHSTLLLLLHSEHPWLKWANIHYLPASASPELKSGFTGWFRFKAFHDVAEKLPARAADSWELDWDCRMCPQVHSYGYWHISEYLFPSSLTLFQADPSSLQYGPLQRPSSLTTWSLVFLFSGLPHGMEADFT